MTIRNKIISNLVTILVAFAAYFVLFHHMSVNDIISTLLTAGNQASIFELSLCMLFVALRFFLIVLLPGILLAVATSLLMEYIAAKTKSHEKLQG